MTLRSEADGTGPNRDMGRRVTHALFGLLVLGMFWMLSFGTPSGVPDYDPHQPDDLTKLRRRAETAKPLIAAVERHKAATGSYPATLSQAGIPAGGAGDWEYDRNETNAYWLSHKVSPDYSLTYYVSGERRMWHVFGNGKTTSLVHFLKK